MKKLKKLFNDVKSCDEFVDAVSRSWWWYCDEPQMRTWTKETLRALYAKWMPPQTGVKLEFTRY